MAFVGDRADRKLEASLLRQTDYFGSADGAAMSARHAVATPPKREQMPLTTAMMAGFGAVAMNFSSSSVSPRPELPPTLLGRAERVIE
jgi:hypothetical protein